MDTREQRYRKIRSENPTLPARIAKHWLDGEEKRTQLLVQAHDFRDAAKLILEVGPFNVHVHFRVDNDSYEWGGGPGAFITKPKPGAIRADRGGRSWFVPGVTYAEHYASLRKTFSRHEADCLARRYVLQDLKRALSFGDDWFWASIVATVYDRATGARLGGDSLAGIESDATSEDLAMFASEVAEQALSEAREVLAKICETHCRESATRKET